MVHPAKVITFPPEYAGGVSRSAQRDHHHLVRLVRRIASHGDGEDQGGLVAQGGVRVRVRSGDGDRPDAAGGVPQTSRGSVPGQLLVPSASKTRPAGKPETV